MPHAGQTVQTEFISGATLKERIVDFVRGASTEITPADEKRLPQLADLLPPRTAVYVAHVPNTTLSCVVKAALTVQRAGLVATPHIVARRRDIYRGTVPKHFHASGIDRPACPPAKSS